MSPLWSRLPRRIRLSHLASGNLVPRQSCSSESCGLQSLTPEVMRSDAATRSVFQAELEKAARSFADGLSKDSRPDANRAWATIAMLIGGVTLARAVQDTGLADEIAGAIRQAATSDIRAESPRTACSSLRETVPDP